MVIIDTVINSLLGRLTLDPAGIHCPSWDDAFVSSYHRVFCTSDERVPLELGISAGSKS